MYDKTTFLSGLAMGLIGKGNPTFEGSDTFSRGYLVGAELRAKRVTIFARAAGLYETGTNNLVYSWKQLLSNEILDGGVIHVADGAVTTNLISGIPPNPSSDILVGDLVLPNDGSVTVLGEYAFAWCKKMTAINIPRAVTRIGYAALSDCAALKTLIIDNRSHLTFGQLFAFGTEITSIYITDMAAWCSTDFSDGTGIISVPLRDAEYLYLNSKPVTDLVVPDGVEVVRDRTFAGYKKLNSISIPESVTEIHSHAFDECPNITAITVSENNQVYRSVDNTVYSKDMKTLFYRFVPYSGVFVVPDGVTTIGYHAFAWATDAMTGVQLPNSVTTIDGQAFYECGGLTSFAIPSSVTSIGSYAFAYCTKLTEVTFAGTVEQWNTIDLHSSWRGAWGSATITRVVCSDGIITL